MRVGGSVAYVSQAAWIMNDTVQENVVMAEDMDPQRYTAAIKAAQLMPDLVRDPAAWLACLACLLWRLGLSALVAWLACFGGS